MHCWHLINDIYAQETCRSEKICGKLGQNNTELATYAHWAKYRASFRARSLKGRCNIGVYFPLCVPLLSPLTPPMLWHCTAGSHPIPLTTLTPVPASVPASNCVTCPWEELPLNKCPKVVQASIWRPPLHMSSSKDPCVSPQSFFQHCMEPRDKTLLQRIVLRLSQDVSCLNWPYPQ